MSDFVKRYGGIYEHSPWIAAAAWDAGLPDNADTVDGLAEALAEVVDRAGSDEKLANAYLDAATVESFWRMPLDGGLATAITPPTLVLDRFDVIAEMTPWLEAQKAKWGIGYRYEFGGEVEGSGKANASIADKLPIAGMVILMLLVWQFNSLRKPTIVLATILFALVGVAIGLVLIALTAYVHFVWGDGQLTYLIDDMWTALSHEALLAIPMFILAGAMAPVTVAFG